MDRIIAHGSVASKRADPVPIAQGECAFPHRKRTTELANRIPSPLGSSP
jgi:hypothetical protein